MSMGQGLGSAIAAVICMACSSKPAAPGPVEPAAPAVAPTGTTSPPPRTTEAPPEAQGSVVKTLFVAEAMVECEGGAGPMQCMRVREAPDGEWTLFYSGIEGFEHEAGHEYELRVQVDKVDDPPADGSSLRYRLLEVVNKKTAKAK